jgi:hypothetical protein
MGKLVAYWIGIAVLWGVVVWAFVGCSPVAPVVVDDAGAVYFVEAKGQRPPATKPDVERLEDPANPCRGGVFCHKGRKDMKSLDALTVIEHLGHGDACGFCD